MTIINLRAVIHGRRTATDETWLRELPAPEVVQLLWDSLSPEVRKEVAKRLAVQTGVVRELAVEAGLPVDFKQALPVVCRHRGPPD